MAPNFEQFGSVGGPLLRLLRLGRLRLRLRHGPRPPRRRDPGRRRRASASPSTWPRPPRAARVEVAYEVEVALRHCHGNGAEPGTPIVTCPRCQGAGQIQAVSRTAFGQLVRTRGLRPLRRRRARARAALHDLPRAPGGAWSTARCTSTSPPASPTASASASPAAATRGSAAGPPGDLYVMVRVREDERFLRDGEDLAHRRRRRRRRSPRSAPPSRCRRSTARCRSRSPPAPSPARSCRCAAAGSRRCSAAARATCTCRQRRHPAAAHAEQRELLEQLADTLGDGDLRAGRGHARQAEARAGADDPPAPRGSGSGSGASGRRWPSPRCCRCCRAARRRREPDQDGSSTRSTRRAQSCRAPTTSGRPPATRCRPHADRRRRRLGAALARSTSGRSR